MPSPRAKEITNHQPRRLGHEAQRRWSHQTALEPLVHDRHGLAELLQGVSHLCNDNLLALNLLTVHVDAAGHEMHAEHGLKVIALISDTPAQSMYNRPSTPGRNP